MENKKIICFGCKALVPNIDGPVHAYMLSAPGCWKLYGEILAREYDQKAYDPDIHRISVDTYAVTHPGLPERRAIQSVSIHLIRLYYVFEKNLKGKQTLEIIKKAADSKELEKHVKWLDPPEFKNTLHVTDVLEAKTTEEHKQKVLAWGKSVWNVWKQKEIEYITKIGAITDK